jgi:hypothetical protein
MNAHQAWQATLGQLQMEMSKAAFDTWVRSTELVSHNEDIFTVGVQNAYARDWLESRLSNTVSMMLSGIMTKPQAVKFVVHQRDFDLTESEAQAEEKTPEPEVELHSNVTIITATILIILSLAPATGWHTPPVWPWQKTPRKHTTRSSSMEGLGWARPTCCMRLAAQPSSAACRWFMCLLKSLPTT